MNLLQRCESATCYRKQENSSLKLIAQVQSEYSKMCLLMRCRNLVKLFIQYSSYYNNNIITSLCIQQLNMQQSKRSLSKLPDCCVKHAFYFIAPTLFIYWRSSGKCAFICRPFLHGNVSLGHCCFDFSFHCQALKNLCLLSVATEKNQKRRGGNLLLLLL